MKADSLDVSSLVFRSLSFQMKIEEVSKGRLPKFFTPEIFVGGGQALRKPVSGIPKYPRLLSLFHISRYFSSAIYIQHGRDSIRESEIQVPDEFEYFDDFGMLRH